MPLLYNEDKALKAKLQGLTVQDATSDPRPVAVRFREPENELADQTFPLIIIDHADLLYDPSRAHAGYVPIPYVPEGYQQYTGSPAIADSPYWSEYPLPMFVDYVITLHCRKALHRTQLMGQLITFDYLLPKFAYLVVPEDNTLRRLDITGGPQFVDHLDSEGKRLFTVMWRVRTTTEIIWSGIDEPANVTSIDLTVTSPGEPS